MANTGFQQVIKSGQSRSVNMMGNTNRMVAHISHHRSNSKPVSINFLRGLVKQYNRQIDLCDEKTGMPVHDSATQARLFQKRNLTFAAIKLFQDAYAKGDNSALSARIFCRMNEIMIEGDSSVTMRQTRDSVQRIAGMLGAGEFDSFGVHSVTKEGKPRIPGGYAVEDEFGQHLDRKDASVKFTPKSREYHDAAKPEFQQYLQRVVRAPSLKEYKKAVQHTPNEAPNTPVERDIVRLGEPTRPGIVKSGPVADKAIKVIKLENKLVVTGTGGSAQFYHAAKTHERKAELLVSQDKGKKAVAELDKAIALANHARNIASNYIEHKDTVRLGPNGIA